MGLTPTLLLLLAQASFAPIPTRIVESRESPVYLVGLPCEGNTKKIATAWCTTAEGSVRR